MNSQQLIKVPAFFFVSPPYAAARHCCAVAHDVFSRPRVENETATVQPVHSEFLLWPRSLVRLEEDLFAERGNPWIESFASDTLVSSHTVTATMERRQCPCCTSYKPFQD